MNLPLLKDRHSLTRADFDRHPVWVRVQDTDQEQPWHADSTEQTYQPWDGPLPLEPRSPFPFVLLAASFYLLNGSLYPGYFQPVTKDWDQPLPPRKMKDGTYTRPQCWSGRHGGSALSVLALHSPVVFIGEKAFDFHLRRDPDRLRNCIRDFYGAIGSRPAEVFPIEFSAAPGLFNGIVSGRLDGFYSFPLNRPFEINRGECYLSGPT